jgi:hypothetical protein
LKWTRVELYSFNFFKFSVHFIAGRSRGRRFYGA